MEATFYFCVGIGIGIGMVLVLARFVMVWLASAPTPWSRCPFADCDECDYPCPRQEDTHE